MTLATGQAFAASRLPAMTATQKLLAYQAGLPFVQAGDEIAVPVSWVLASELALNGMLITHRELGEPPLARPDRFILAVDHSVASFGEHHEVARRLIRLSEEFRIRQRLVHFYPANETILHTDPYEKLFRPGDVVVGADSHTIFHGGLGAFAIGLGGADVMMAAMLGSLLFTVPEAIQIEIDGRLPGFWTGKDLILALLQQFRRNTLAFERTVEYVGPGLRHLSASERGTASNMGAEFGAMSSFFVPNENIARFLANRRNPEFREGGLYFAPDPDAPYVARERFDPSTQGAPKIGVWPSPDNVHDLDDPQVAGRPFDIAFVGTCTTTPEEYVLAALTADAATRAGWQPAPSSNPMSRLLSPSSIGILQMLQGYGLVEALERVGFNVGRAGCSLCLAIDGHAAPSGSWVLGSHNRPFPNRTGRGSMSMVANAGTVVASSVQMKVTDPRVLDPHFDHERYRRILADLRGESLRVPEIQHTEPSGGSPGRQPQASIPDMQDLPELPRVIRTKVVRFGNNVDTDAIIPGRFCHLVNLQELGNHAFENEMGEGEFRRRVRDEGRGAVVAESGWGSGSSREHAVLALQGAGVQFVLAKSIAFIHRLNLVTQAVPFRLIHPDDHEAFYGKIQEGMEIEVNFDKEEVTLVDTRETFRLMPIRPMEETIQSLGGLLQAYKRFGRETIPTLMALAEQRRRENPHILLRSAHPPPRRLVSSDVDAEAEKS